jgi:hypothetical protein
LRRSKEFDKPDAISDAFYGIIPEHHTVKPMNDEWRYQRKLMQDRTQCHILFTFGTFTDGVPQH